MVNSDREALLRENLARIVESLKENYHPEKVILFGSLSGGSVSSTSDIDLLIIKNTRKSFYDRLREVALLCDYDVGVDMIVYTPREYQEQLRTNTFFKIEIAEKGKVLYGRAS